MASANTRIFAYLIDKNASEPASTIAAVTIVTSSTSLTGRISTGRNMGTLLAMTAKE